MAFYTSSIDAEHKASSAFTFFSAIAGFFDRLTAAQNRSAEVQRMQDLSDQELANICLKRDDIVRHVYRDIYYV